MKTFFWDVAPCSLVEVDDVSEVRTASIALVMEAVHTSETCESSHLYTGRRENLKSHNDHRARLYLPRPSAEDVVLPSIDGLSNYKDKRIFM
jgi:hypothetical protein